MMNSNTESLKPNDKALVSVCVWIGRAFFTFGSSHLIKMKSTSGKTKQILPFPSSLTYVLPKIITNIFFLITSNKYYLKIS